LITFLVVQRVAPASLPVFFEEGEATLISSIGVTYMMLVVLWGTARLGRDVAALGTTVARLTQGAFRAGEPFRAVGSVWGPLGLILFITVLYVGFGLVQSPSVPRALAALVLLVGWLPLLTFVWVAGAVLLGLHRLGGTALSPAIV